MQIFQPRPANDCSDADAGGGELAGQRAHWQQDAPVGVGIDSVGAVELGCHRHRMLPVTVPVLDHLIEYRTAAPVAAKADGGGPSFLLCRYIYDVHRSALSDDALPSRRSGGGVVRTCRYSQRGDTNQADLGFDHLCPGHAEGWPCSAQFYSCNTKSERGCDAALLTNQLCLPGL
jgi:hypothetical protein